MKQGGPRTCAVKPVVGVGGDTISAGSDFLGSRFELDRGASLAWLQQIIRNGRPSDAKVSSADRLGGLAQVPDLCARKVMQERRQDTSHAKHTALDGGLHTNGDGRIGSEHDVTT